MQNGPQMLPVSPFWRNREESTSKSENRSDLLNHLNGAADPCIRLPRPTFVSHISPSAWWIGIYPFSNKAEAYRALFFSISCRVEKKGSIDTRKRTLSARKIWPTFLTVHLVNALWTQNLSIIVFNYKICIKIVLSLEPFMKTRTAVKVNRSLRTPKSVTRSHPLYGKYFWKFLVFANKAIKSYFLKGQNSLNALLNQEVNDTAQTLIACIYADAVHPAMCLLMTFVAEALNNGIKIHTSTKAYIWVQKH